MSNSGNSFVLVTAVLTRLCLSGRGHLHKNIKPVDISGQDLDLWLENREANIPDIIPGTEKTIKWSGKPNVATPLSIVYIHGFTATRQETAPVFDRVAEALHANLYYTRLKGHGRDAEAMKEPKFNDWLNEQKESLTIKRELTEDKINWAYAHEDPEIPSSLLNDSRTVQPSIAPTFTPDATATPGATESTPQASPAPAASPTSTP